MAGEATQAFKDIALEQKDDQGSLKLQENFDKKFETSENRDKLYKAAKEGLNNLDDTSKDTIKQGIEKTIQTPDFQSKFDEVIKIDKSTWLNKGALSPQQRGMVSLLYLFGGLNGDKNASPEDVINIYNRLKNNPTIKPLEPVAYKSDNSEKTTETTAEKIFKNTEPQKTNNSVASRENLVETKPLGDIIGTIPSIDENMEAQKIMKKIKRLEKGLDDDNNTEEINEKQSNIKEIDSKIQNIDNKIKEKDEYIQKIPENLRQLLLAKNQGERTVLNNEKQILVAQKNILEKDITELQNEELKDNKKDEKQFEKISAQVIKLQEQLLNTKEKYTGQKDFLTNQVTSIKNLIVGDDILNTLSESDKEVIIKQNNALKPQLADLQKQLDTIDQNLAQLDTIISEKGGINTYLAQYKQEKTDDVKVAEKVDNEKQIEENQNQNLLADNSEKERKPYE